MRFTNWFFECKSRLGVIHDWFLLCSLSFRANPHGYTKFCLIDKVRRLTNSRTLVETGTFLGVTTERGSKVFESVVTIELCPDLAARAKERLKKLKNVRVVEGCAVLVLRQVLSDPAVTDALVFLDGHFSGPGTARGDEPEPAVQEFKILNEFKDKINAVIVDDFRTFGRKDFPAKSMLLEAAERFAGEAFEIRVFYDQLILCRVPTTAGRITDSKSDR